VLSRDWMLALMYYLKTETELFLEMKGKLFSQLYDHDWMLIFASYMDVPQYMNNMNINLQRANHLIKDVFGKITAFQRKLPF
jgi:hypothetical protein